MRVTTEDTVCPQWANDGIPRTSGSGQIMVSAVCGVTSGGAGDSIRFGHVFEEPSSLNDFTESMSCPSFGSRYALQQLFAELASSLISPALG